MATMSQAGIPGVGNGYLHPKQRNRWRLTFQGIGQGGPGNTADLSLQLISTNRPSLNFDEIQMDRYTTRAYVAGKYTWDPLNITFEDDVGGRASQIIRNQVENQQKLIGATGPWLNAAPTASGYKFGSKLSMMDGNEGILEEWLLEGCFITNVNWGDLDYADGGAVQIQTTIRFDHARNSLSGQGYGTALGGLL